MMKQEISEILEISIIGFVDEKLGANGIAEDMFLVFVRLKATRYI